MLANALLCPDLQNAPASYQNVSFYLDTPLLVRRLGLEDKSKEDAIGALIDLLIKLGGKVAAFSHSCDELQNVIKGTADNLDTPEGRGAIVFEARKRGTTRSDLLLIADMLEDRLRESGIKVEPTPPYVKEFQINEKLFEEMLDEEIPYRHNPQSIKFDTNSVRSIYVLRRNKLVKSIEKARAVFVTSNDAVARAAWNYDRHFEPSQNVSSVITDFSLANTAWLKAPMGASQIPTTQLLAFSYAALEPSDEFLGKYMAEIERLELSGEITERNHQLLRSSTSAIPEVMRVTLGEDSAITKETVTQTLERVTSELKKEEIDKLASEQEAHQRTRDKLDSQTTQIFEMKNNLYWKSRKKSNIWALACSVGLASILAGCLFVGLGFLPEERVPEWLRVGSPLVLALATYLGQLFGGNVKSFRERIQDKFLAWFLKREEKIFGISLNEFNTEDLDTSI